MLTAGAYIGDQFVPGAQVNASLQEVAPTSSASSHFLLDGVFVLYDLPALVGIATEGMP